MTRADAGQAIAGAAPHVKSRTLPRAYFMAALSSFGAAGDDPDRIVGQRPLQHLGLIPRRAHQTSHSSSVSRITGRAFGWIGSSTPFGDVVRKP
jgi:hypothetical protein